MISFLDHGEKPYFEDLTSYSGRTYSILTLLPSIKLQKCYDIGFKETQLRCPSYYSTTPLLYLELVLIVTIMFSVIVRGRVPSALFAKQIRLHESRTHRRSQHCIQAYTIAQDFQHWQCSTELLFQNSLHHPFHHTQAVVSEALESWISPSNNTPSSNNTLTGASVQFEVLINPYADAYSYC